MGEAAKKRYRSTDSSQQGSHEKLELEFDDLEETAKPMLRAVPETDESHSHESELTKVELEKEEKVHHETRKAIETATQMALDKPLNLSKEDVMTLSGAQILRNKLGAHSKDPSSNLIDTLSGEMAVVSGIEEPHALLIPYQEEQIFAISSPGIDPEGHSDKNNVGFVVKSNNRDKTVRIFMADGKGVGPYLGDEAAGLANAAVAEAGAMVHTEELFHLGTVLDQMNRSVNYVKADLHEKNRYVSLLGAEIDMHEETAKLKVASAGDIRCLIINPETGAVHSSTPQTVEATLAKKTSSKSGKAFSREERAEILVKLASKEKTDIHKAAKALTMVGGKREGEFVANVEEFDVPAGFVVVLADNGLIDELDGDFHNKELILGKYVSDELQQGIPLDEILSNVTKGYLSGQKDKKLNPAGFALVGMQIPEKKGRNGKKTGHNVPEEDDVDAGWD